MADPDTRPDRVDPAAIARGSVMPDRAKNRETSVVWTATVCALLILPVALSPDLHPWSRAACQVIAAAAAVGLFLRKRHHGLLPPHWSLILLPLAAASIMAAACRSRALDEAADGALLIVAGVVARGLRAGRTGRRAVAIVLVTLGAAVSLQAVLQHHVTYPRWAESLRASDHASPDLLVFLEAGRPAGPFTLPAALGGFLALSLPSTLAFAFSAGQRGVLRLAAPAAALLQLYAMALTRSIGAVLALAAGLLLTLPLRRPGRRALVGVAVILVAALGAGSFLLARRLEVAAAAGLDPLSLRLGNWRAATGMIRDHPLFGVGPGSFVTFYGRYMREGMNETRYAHNTYLQAAATWGPWILFPIGMMILAVARRLGASSAGDPLEPAVLSGACAFLIHNLGDFTAYLPGVAIPAAILVGLSVAPKDHESERASPPRGLPPLLLMAIVGTAAVGWATHALVHARTLVLREEALDAADRGDILDAARKIRRAGRLRPGDPDPPAFLAQMILAHRMDDATSRAEGEEAAARALDLDPESANFHYTRALYYQAAGQMAIAYREIQAAHGLFPLKSLYRDHPGDSQGAP